MTREDAIKILKPLFEQCKGKNGCLGYIEHFFTKNEEEAFDMAIRALEQQLCNDCISRQVVIEWLKDKDIIKMKNQEEKARRELAELSSVIPQTESEE